MLIRPCPRHGEGADGPERALECSLTGIVAAASHTSCGVATLFRGVVAIRRSPRPEPTTKTPLHLCKNAWSVGGFAGALGG